MKELNNQGEGPQSIDDLTKEIRVLKRKLSIAEIDLARARVRTESQDRVETIWNNSLKKELQFFKLVLENTTNILLLFDFDGRFAYASSIFLMHADILDFSVINGRHFRDVFRPLISVESLDRFSQAVDNANALGNTVSMEEQIDFNFHGSPRTFLILITPMTDENGKITGTMALFNDITEIKNALKTANQANQAKSAFLAKMSHEIRTPMNAIIGMTELVMRNDIPSVVREHILTIRQAGMNLLSIIDDILDFSKIETGKLEIIPKEYLFSSLINDVISIINTKVLESRLRFVVYIDSNIPNALIGDEARIRQIMLNLLSNAVKYTDRGHLSLSITGAMKDSETMLLVIKVSDTGKGIRQDDIEKLFDEFTRFDPARNTSIEGTGLGLAITQNLVKAMNGSIDVNSKYGEGSEFTVNLPQKVRNGQKLAAVDNTAEKKTLIFERREIYANSIKKTMDSLGVGYKLVSTDDEFFNEVMGRQFQYVFVSSVLYENIRKKYSEFKSNAKFLLITEFGETMVDRNISIITTPVFSIPIAKFLNGVTESTGYISRHETKIRFTAPAARVLIVDDLNTNLKVAEGLMLPYDMQIEVCNNGARAIDMIKTERYDLVFMDHMMPEMDGIETTARIRELGADDDYFLNVPIIALTANAVSGTKEMFLENNFNDFLPKPIDTFLLDVILDKWIPKEKQVDFSGMAAAAAGQEKSRGIEIKGLNMKEGIAMAGGSVSNYLNTLAVFHSDGTKKIREIKMCLETDNIQLYAIHVHAMKSALAIIGCDRLSETAKMLEAAGKQGDLFFIKLHTGTFLAELGTLLASIHSYLFNLNANGQNDALDKALLREELNGLKTALGNFDFELMKNNAAGLRNFTRSPEVGPAIENILQNVLIGKYDEASALIDSLLIE